jgi:hypothetical protein
VDPSGAEGAGDGGDPWVRSRRQAGFWAGGSLEGRGWGGKRECRPEKDKEGSESLVRGRKWEPTAGLRGGSPRLA